MVAERGDVRVGEVVVPDVGGGVDRGAGSGFVQIRRRGQERCTRGALEGSEVPAEFGDGDRHLAPGGWAAVRAASISCVAAWSLVVAAGLDEPVGELPAEVAVAAVMVASVMVGVFWSCRVLRFSAVVTGRWARRG